MNQLQTGFARVEITPPLGVSINGYFIPRKAETILDPLEANCIAFRCGTDRVLLVSIDNLGISQKIMLPLREAVAQALGLCTEAVLIHATHSHTAAAVSPGAKEEKNLQYRDFLREKLIQGAKEAFSDCKNAKMGWAVGTAPRVAFVRRFRMKDGSVRTNPGTNHPEIDGPLGEVDERVNVLRFDREGGETLILMNFGNHPDTVGGCRISADWPGFARRSVEQALPGTKAVLFNGAQGDVNHINVWPKGGEGNGLVRAFDVVDRCCAHSELIGRVVAGAVLQVYGKVCYTSVDRIRFGEKSVRVPSNRPTADQLPLARTYAELHRQGRDEEIPFTGMQLTTAVARSLRILRLENGPDYFNVPMSALALGNVVWVGIAGEPFTGIGRALKEAKGWDLVCPICCTNGYEGYFPMKSAYEEGGYEAGSSNFKEGVAELLIREGLDLISSLRSE